MPLYENSVIYKLVHCNDQDNENIYIGSTTNFRGRKSQHKSDCYNSKAKNYNINVYQFIRDNGVWEEWLMIPIEVYSCNNKRELEVRERYYIELMKPKLNKYIPTRTYKEYIEDNKEHVKEYNKQYYENNIEKISKRSKKHYENNQEYIAEKAKIYRENNKECIKEQRKQYREVNKEKISEQRKEQVVCDCGCEIRKNDLSRHQKTKKHIQIMEKWK